MGWGKRNQRRHDAKKKRKRKKEKRREVDPPTRETLVEVAVTRSKAQPLCPAVSSRKRLFLLSHFAPLLPFPRQ
ncbi:hypothetical protein TRSC58_07510 [Trypanosoma rangeli SC58]|uniref:Uncharacterized protein n=1 Tax=Trypanosoma rangeli SC58 TaxID=429131 RepID=A0A061IT06_TRYRA|nr:hypothetical protein TRSC58_07510 [Trypanosoma rangeli SC58]